MSTLYITHDAFLEHDTGEWHPERPDRLRAIDRVLSGERFQNLHRVEAPAATREQIVRAHAESYFDFVERAQPKKELIPLDDGDTMMSPGSWNAALRSAGAGIQAVDEVMQGLAGNAFCLVRPPGHHAEPREGPGFLPVQQCGHRSASCAGRHTEPNAWRSSISMSTTETARRRCSGHVRPAFTHRPIRCRCFRARAALPSAARRAISLMRRSGRATEAPSSARHTNQSFCPPCGGTRPT